MSKRIVWKSAIQRPDVRRVTIYKDSEWGEYVCRLTEPYQTKPYEPADYFTSDYADAVATANSMVVGPRPVQRNSRARSRDTALPPRYPATFCSQCGGEFGAGNHGFSDCKSHYAHYRVGKTKSPRKAAHKALVAAHAKAILKNPTVTAKGRIVLQVRSSDKKVWNKIFHFPNTTNGMEQAKALARLWHKAMPENAYRIVKVKVKVK